MHMVELRHVAHPWLQETHTFPERKVPPKQLKHCEGLLTLQRAQLDEGVHCTQV